MHDAYEAAPLLKLNVQIESIAAYDDNLLVGTSKGHLLMYSVSCRLGERKNDVQLLGYHKNFSKKPIQQMAVVPEYQILISLSDGIVSVHDMATSNFAHVFTAHRTKGATSFALDIQKSQTLTGEIAIAVRLCVAVKRRLQLFYWKNGKLLDLREDLCVPDVPKSLVWCEETICVGFKGEYCLLKLSGESKELFPTGKNLEPSLTRLSDDTLALGKDSQTILMDAKGSLTNKYPIKWSDVPLNLAHDDPYLLGVVNETVEVRSVEPNLHIQSIQLQRPRLISCVRQGKLFVASGTQVWCLQAVTLSRQIHHLLEEKQFQLALKLANISDETPEEKRKNIYHIQTLYAFHLFSNQKFQESMKEFLKLGTDPCEVIRLFPDLMPQMTGNQLSNTQPMNMDEKDLGSGLLALIEFLTEVRNKLKVDNRNLDDGNHNSGSSSNSKSTEQLFQIIDTTLLKCYLKTNDALVAPLLRLNHCHLAETEKNLKKYQKHSELIILYQTKGLHQKALDLLKKQANVPDSPLRGHEKTVQYLQHLGKENMSLIFEFAGWVLEAHPEDGLKIFIEDVPEVENLPRPLVLDYLLRTQKSLVIPYLEHVVNVWEDPNPLFHNALVHQYQEKVQQLMVEESNKSPAKTKGDAEGNLEIMDVSDGDSRVFKPPRVGDEPGELGRYRKKLLSILETSTRYTPETVLVQFPYDCLFEERAIVLGKLGRHEQVLSIYISILQDIQLAMNYCEKTYQKQAEGHDEVYIILIKMLINPPESWIVGVQPTKSPEPNIELALDLLSENASKINSVKALSVLPDDVPLWRVKKFVETSLQNVLDERRKIQVQRGLLYAEHLQVEETKLRHESQSFMITEFNVCPVCKKRFGNQSAFARYPNGDIVHYSCQEKKA